MAEINRIRGVVVGQYGEALQFTIVDKDGNAVDISAYNQTKTATLRDQFTLKTLSYTATFVTDGTNGQIQFTPASGDIDRPGDWELQFTLTSITAKRLTAVAVVGVEKALA